MFLGLWLALILALMQGVMCQDWKVTMPQRIMGVEGSCVTVPCSFEIPSRYEPDLKVCSGEAVWKRGFLYSPRTRTGDLVGDLRQKNCTTVFQNFTKEDEDFYFFRLDCKNKLVFSFNEEVHISVTPGNLTSMTSVRHVTEGSEVMLQCVAMVPCPFLPPSIIWTAPQSNKQEQILQSSDGQMMLKSMLTFTASAQHHKDVVTCSVSYPLPAGGSTEARTTSYSLNVSCSHTGVLWVSAVSGLCVLYVLTVALLCYKYRSVWRKLKDLEQREENIYCDLQISQTPDYDSLKVQSQRNVKTPAEDLDYENAAALKKDFKKT